MFSIENNYDLNNREVVKPTQERVRQFAVKYDNIDQIDIAQELVNQLNTAQQLLLDAEWDEDATLAQKASTVQAITKIIETLTKLRTELWNAERLKVQEAVLIETLKQFPDTKQAFIEAYKEALANAKLA